MTVLVDHAPALLRDVLANPADDAPRLILADWLEEQGQSARAEFIHLQCELAKSVPRCQMYMASGTICYQAMSEDRWCWACKRIGLLNTWRRRSQELFDGFGMADERAREFSLPSWAYVEDVPMRADSQVLQTWKVFALVRRGFVAALTCSAADFLTHADAITAAQPIEYVTLTTFTDADDYLLVEIWHDEKPDELLYKTPLGMLSDLWPRITFTLPTTNPE